MSNFETGTSGYRGGGGEAMVSRISELFLKPATEDQLIQMPVWDPVETPPE